MSISTNPWEDDYLCRGRLWGGSPSSLPRLPDSSRVLELGCGSGKTISSLMHHGCSVIALDLSRTAVLLCREAGIHPDRAELLVADARQVPFRNESFDVIIASHITGHLTRTGRTLLAGEATRLLAVGGLMFFRDFSAGDFRNGRGIQTEEGTFLRKTGIATHYFTEEEVPDLFAGLTVRSLAQHRWGMKVRGSVFPRAEIVAELIKPS
jgi:SAM-dependent methyltransferase